ncbi:hypothetical protein NW762_007957 [Fusarium torreyae]|uniref:Beta-lactamase-related domain-containing protein n=1 Tax=Fusarium torreyae TaxID=1237075 RepID=A0A9W8S0K1_9HYPO|nr:hypothetical protein NW762_007957 [Fusarium torreyae]
MRVKIFGTAIFAFLYNLATARATSPYPLFGPDLPIPIADASLRNILSDILKVLHPGVPSSARNLGINLQNTSFSIVIYSARNQRPLANFHHTAQALKHHKYGTRIVNDTSIYRIGSVSKLLTAYLYLLEVGDASFNEPITRYVPELAAMSTDKGDALRNVDWNAVTISAIASHMAGIPRDFPNPPSSDHELARLGFPPVPPVDVAYCGKTVQYPCNRSAAFNAIKMHYPVEAPFETPIYSNIGYQLMGYALENITGSKYPDILSRRLIQPLRLNSTTYSKPANDDFSVIPDTPSDSSYDVEMGDAGPAGSIYSSIADLRRIGQSILSYEMLSPSRTRRGLKPLTFTADPNLAVGAPWEIARAPSTTKRSNWIYTKGGDLGMYKSLVSLMPDWGIGITILAAGSDVSELFNAVTGQITSELVASLEKAAKHQAIPTYNGLYGDKKSNVTLSVQKDLPGLAVTSWFFKERDMFDWVRFLVTGSQTGPGNVSMRLYPTGLQERGKGKNSRESWRAVYEILDDGTPSSPYCAPWFGVDSVTYGGVSVDEFVIDLSQDGTTQGLTVSAFDTRLKRAKH